MFAVGDEVTVVKQIYEPADDYQPDGMLARLGEKLIIREIREAGEWPFKVSHEFVTDGRMFGVSEAELKPYAVPCGIYDADLSHL